MFVVVLSAAKDMLPAVSHYSTGRDHMLLHTRAGNASPVHGSAPVRTGIVTLATCLALCSAETAQSQRIAPIGVTRSAISAAVRETSLPALDAGTSHRGHIIGATIGAVIGAAFGAYTASESQQVVACPTSGSLVCIAPGNVFKGSMIGMLFGALLGFLIGGEF